MPRPASSTLLWLALLFGAEAALAQEPAVRRATTFGRVLAQNATGKNSLQEQSRGGLAVTRSGLACLLVARDDGGSDRAERFHLELYYSSNEGLAWSLLGDLETKDDRQGALAADPKRDLVHVVWSATGVDGFQSVWYIQADLTTARFVGRPQAILLGTSLVDDYAAEDVCVASDGTVVAGVRAGPKALAKSGLASGTVGVCLLRPGSRQWTLPVRVSERPARDLCMAPIEDAVHLLWRETHEDHARHRALDAATGAFRDSGAHVVAFGAEDKTKLEPGLSLCADAGGNLWALAAVAGTRPGEGRLVFAHAPGPGCAAWTSTVLAKDSQLVMQSEPPPFCMGRYAGDRVLALWSQADTGHRELRSALLAGGKLTSEPSTLADEKTGGPFAGFGAGRVVAPEGPGIKAVAGLGGLGAVSLVSIVVPKVLPVVKGQAKPPSPTPTPDTRPTAPAEPAVAQPTAAPQAQAHKDQPARPGKKEPKPLSGIYAARTDGRARLAKNRALKNSDSAITQALAWLAKHQDEDGHFDVAGFTKHDDGKPSGGLGKAERDVGATALGLLAFLADGNTLDRGPLKSRVTSAVDWLMHKQKPDGLLGEQDHEQFLLDHALATLALAEAAGSSSNAEAKLAAQKAVTRLLAHRKDGAAFAKAPSGDDTETELTAWCVLALWTAREADVRVDAKALADAQSYLLLATDPETGRCAPTRAATTQVAAKPTYFVPPVESATGAALLCRSLLGESTQTTPALRKGVALVRNQQPEWDEAKRKVDFSGWFFCAHALFELDQAAFGEWQERLVQMLVGAQRRDGTAAGSWDSAPDPAAGGLGRIATTALGVLALAAPYRVARQDTEAGDEGRQVIRVAGLCKSYGERRAVDGLSLTAAPGEITALLGPNGAGKTTTIHCIVGLETPDAGTIEVAGHDVRKDPLGSKRSLAYVPEIASLYDALTPQEYLVLKGRLFGIDDATILARIERLLDGFELLERRHDPIASFSKGMTQKVALCSALLVEAPVLLLDEPMSGLDAPSALLLKEVMREHARRQRTVLYSTHVLDVAESLAHRIVVLHEGRLAASGTLQELRAKSGSEDKLEQIFQRLTEQSDPIARAKALLGG